MTGGGAGAHCRWQAGLAWLHTGMLGQAVAQRAFASSQLPASPGFPLTAVPQAGRQRTWEEGGGVCLSQSPPLVFR